MGHTAKRTARARAHTPPVYEIQDPPYTLYTGAVAVRARLAVAAAILRKGVYRGVCARLCVRRLIRQRRRPAKDERRACWPIDIHRRTDAAPSLNTESSGPCVYVHVATVHLRIIILCAHSMRARVYAW